MVCKAAELKSNEIPEKDLLKLSTMVFDLTDPHVNLPEGDLLLVADLLYDPKTAVCEL